MFVVHLQCGFIARGGASNGWMNIFQNKASNDSNIWLVCSRFFFFSVQANSCIFKGTVKKNPVMYVQQHFLTQVRNAIRILCDICVLFVPNSKTTVTWTGTKQESAALTRMLFGHRHSHGHAHSQWKTVFFFKLEQKEKHTNKCMNKWISEGCIT